MAGPTFSGLDANGHGGTLRLRYPSRDNEMKAMSSQQNIPQRDARDPRDPQQGQAQQNPDQQQPRKNPQHDDEEE